MIRLDNIDQRYGKQILLTEASAAINKGEKIGLVGPNGAGKSTIFRLIVREEEPDGGQVTIDRDVTIGHFSQDVGEMSGETVVEAVLRGAGMVSEVASELHKLEAAMADPENPDLEKTLERYGDVQARFYELGGYALESQAREILSGLGFREEVMDRDVGLLSGGWKMRVALARILLMKPDVMLLDEPSNHLDIESLIWLERFLKEYPGAVLMTSHDRELMNRIVGKIIEIDGGELITYSGNYDFYMQQRAIMEAQAEAQFARQEAMLAKERRFIERFKAQAAKAAQVQSRVKKLDKIEKLEPPKKRKTLQFEFGHSPRLGEEVVRCDHIEKRYDTRTIYDGLDFLLRRGERWCVMGQNGAGKSTLLKIVSGEINADAGRVVLGPSVKLGYFAQHAMELLSPEQTVWETLVAKFPLASVGSLRTLAGCFGFSGDDIDKRTRNLSGGEKVRLVMARLLYDSPNFLVFDEPTNHLDIATKEMLVTALKDFEGSMLFVSHDRKFLSALANKVLELDGDQVKVYQGTYDEYVRASGHEAPGIHD
ncbi:MAG: ABC-F family ATP-binding cassette domain-containing protein [Myxococcota bacterium]